MKTLIITLSILILGALPITEDPSNLNEDFPITSSNVAKGSSAKVIVFAGNHCKDNCYEAGSLKYSCMWFDTGNLVNASMRFPDLSKKSGSYEEKYNKRWIGGREHGYEKYDTRWVTFTWENEINRIYIGNNYTKVAVWTGTNFTGSGREFWGQGCIDLDNYGLKNKVNSMKISYR